MPYEPLKEKQEDGGYETMIKKQINALNSTLINFLKGNAPDADAHLLLMPMGNAKFVEGKII